SGPLPGLPPLRSRLPGRRALRRTAGGRPRPAGRPESTATPDSRRPGAAGPATAAFLPYSAAATAGLDAAAQLARGPAPAAAAEGAHGTRPGPGRSPEGGAVRRLHRPPARG